LTATAPPPSTSDPVGAARRWLADDPDPGDRAELLRLLDGLPASLPEVADRFAGPLTFGTAGLRGPMRAGETGMNVAVVRAATSGLMAWLREHDARGPLVVGYDGRHRSREFAAQVLEVARGAGRKAFVLPRPLPTPVLAHAVRTCAAAAGVMITASHNPARDNGYKVYLGAELGGPAGTGAQLVAPADASIEAAIRAVGSLRAIPTDDSPAAVIDESIVERYVDGVLSLLGSASSGPRRSLRIAYTAMHGVGSSVLREVMRRAGFIEILAVTEQDEPDPDFPTVRFPNPEEPGAMDLLLARAERAGADLAIANDPDADRCAVAVPDRGRWRMLHGDEVGILLADHLMSQSRTGLYATTVVSSSMLGALCRARGHRYAETLTGFKWIVRATDGSDAPLRYGYEEALGYCVAPDHVRDKDGISAALLVAELVARLAMRGRTLVDRLDELATEVGVHLTGALSVRVERVGDGAAILHGLRADPPATLAGRVVAAMDEPAADVFRLRAEGCRVVIRPSGTEPKLKVYLESLEPVGPDGVDPARARAAAVLAHLSGEMTSRLAGAAGRGDGA
jgi:phosphomannomutase